MKNGNMWTFFMRKIFWEVKPSRFRGLQNRRLQKDAEGRGVIFLTTLERGVILEEIRYIKNDQNFPIFKLKMKIIFAAALVVFLD